MKSLTVAIFSIFVFLVSASLATAQSLCSLSAGNPPGCNEAAGCAFGERCTTSINTRVCTPDPACEDVPPEPEPPAPDTSSCGPNGAQCGGCDNGYECRFVVNNYRCVLDTQLCGPTDEEIEPTSRCGDEQTVGKCGSAGGCDSGQFCYECTSGQGCPAFRCGFVNGECGYDEDEGLYNCGDYFSWNQKGPRGGCPENQWCKFRAGQGAGWSCRPEEPDEQSINRGEQALSRTPMSVKLGFGCGSNGLGEEGKINSAIGCIPYTDVSETAQFLIRWSLGVGGGLALFLVALSGIRIATTKGDEKRLQDARDMLSSAIAGIVLIVLSIFVIRFITETLLQLF